jgi:hypothetical protein
MSVGLNGSCHSSQGSAALKEGSHLGDQNALQGDEKGAFANVRGSHGDDRCAFLPILGNVLTVGESAGSEE